MKRKKLTIITLAIICAVATAIFSKLVPTSVATIPSGAVSTPAIGDADLSAESRTLDDFLTAVGNFDTKNAELARKESLTREELNTHEGAANDLKQRLSGVQNALREVMRKLKAAGEWDNLDKIVLEKIHDARMQDFIRREGFKRILEQTASGGSTDADEFVRPLNLLRNKVRAQIQNSFEPSDSRIFRVSRVSFTPSVVMAATGLRCRLSMLREGLSAGFSDNGSASKGSLDAVQCHCFGLSAGGRDCGKYAPTE